MRREDDRNLSAGPSQGATRKPARHAVASCGADTDVRHSCYPHPIELNIDKIQSARFSHRVASRSRGAAKNKVSPDAQCAVARSCCDTRRANILMYYIVRHHTWMRRESAVQYTMRRATGNKYGDAIQYTIHNDNIIQHIQHTRLYFSTL